MHLRRCVTSAYHRSSSPSDRQADHIQYACAQMRRTWLATALAGFGLACLRQSGIRQFEQIFALAGRVAAICSALLSTRSRRFTLFGVKRCANASRCRSSSISIRLASSAICALRRAMRVGSHAHFEVVDILRHLTPLSFVVPAFRGVSSDLFEYFRKVTLASKTAQLSNLGESHVCVSH